jgi:hypothetical protein
LTWINAPAEHSTARTAGNGVRLAKTMVLSSAVRTFTDPDDYAGAIRAARVEITVTERGDYTAHQTRIDLHRLWMQRLSDSLPRIIHGDLVPGRAVITFLAPPGPDAIVNGVPMPLGVIVRHREAHDLHQRSVGATTLAAISLPAGFCWVVNRRL